TSTGEPAPAPSTGVVSSSSGGQAIAAYGRRCRGQVGYSKWSDARCCADAMEATATGAPRSVRTPVRYETGSAPSLRAIRRESGGRREWSDGLIDPFDLV